jgi:hypothetical protein
MDEPICYVCFELIYRAVTRIMNRHSVSADAFHYAMYGNGSVDGLLAGELPHTLSLIRRDVAIELDRIDRAHEATDDHYW